MNPTTKLHNRLYLFLAKGNLCGALVVGAVSMWSFGVMSIVLRFMSGHALANEASRLVEAVIIPQSAASLLALGIAFISDEIYHGLTYGEPSQTAMKISNQATVVYTFSKYFS